VNRFIERRLLITALLLPLSTVSAAQQPTIRLQFDPEKTTAPITLSATLHTVHGKFLLQHGEIKFDPGSGKISGEIVFDATSGKTGNEGRDRKMHKDVLESAKFPQITFRPDRVEGKVAESGPSSAQVHGIFSFHGTDHELTIPVEVRLEGGHWTASAQFSIPYEKWGLKNPSTMFLHVGDSVEVEFHGEGKVSENQ
jgi:polyisoprenoid-binding protein YceI